MNIFIVIIMLKTKICKIYSISMRILHKHVDFSRFSYFKLFIKIMLLFILLYLIKSIIGNFNWVGVDWYIRMSYPNLYRHLSSNILLIMSFSVALCLLLFTCIGLRQSILVTITIPIQLILLLAVKYLLQVWFYFLCFIYIFIACLEIFKYLTTNFTTRRLKKKIETFKYAICILFLLYYNLWNYYNNEPLTNFVSTPDFIPPSLCPNSNSSVNFDETFKYFVIDHNKMMDSSRLVPDRKAVIFRCYDGGLGNRIQGLLSSFLLAILLKRAFFVEWIRNEKEAYASINDLFEVSYC